jgi:hypothetical protein
MEHHHQAVIRRREAQDARSAQRAADQVERPPRLLKGEPAGLRVPRFCRQRCEIDAGEPRSRPLGGDLLHRLSSDAREPGAEGLVAAEDLQHRALQGRQLKRTVQVHDAWDVVSRALRVELMEEPKPLLGEGER